MTKPTWWPQASDGTNAVVVVDFKNGAYWYFDGVNYNSVPVASAINEPSRVTAGVGAKWVTGNEDTILFLGALNTALMSQFPVSVTSQFDFTPGGVNSSSFWLFSYSHDADGADDMELDLDFRMFNNGSTLTQINSNVYDGTGGQNPMGKSVTTPASPAVLACSYNGASGNSYTHAIMSGGAVQTVTGTATSIPLSPAGDQAFAGNWDSSPVGTLGQTITIENIVMFPLLSDAVLLSVSTPGWWAGAGPGPTPTPNPPIWGSVADCHPANVMFGFPG